MRQGISAVYYILNDYKVSIGKIFALQVEVNIYYARRHHKLAEWHTLCAWIESLPYADKLICIKDAPASDGNE